jgi:hypothetical protein
MEGALTDHYTGMASIISLVGSRHMQYSQTKWNFKKQPPA